LSKFQKDSIIIVSKDKRLWRSQNWDIKQSRIDIRETREFSDNK